MLGVVIKLGNTEQLLNKPMSSVIQGPLIAGCTFLNFKVTCSTFLLSLWQLDNSFLVIVILLQEFDLSLLLDKPCLYFVSAFSTCKFVKNWSELVGISVLLIKLGRENHKIMAIL